ncbi:MAG: hypothetical protein SFV51_29590, partial [Bryobacteraceae bacterium]|nr:hypothetical protein [Bryobacteraceae bacterium]
MPTRRDFLLATGAAFSQAAAAQVGRPVPQSDKKVRLGVVGGGFGTQFYFHQHPNCQVTAVTDLRPDRRAALQKHYHCETAYASL